MILALSRVDHGARNAVTQELDDGTTLTGTEAILPFLDQTYDRRTDADRHRARARAEVPYFEENKR